MAGILTPRRIEAALMVAVGLAAGTLLLRHQAVRFEARAQRAEALSGLLTRQAAVLQHQIDSLSGVKARRDTIIRTIERQIVVVDSENPVPDTCLPNIAARDHLITEQRAQISDLGAAFNASQAQVALLREANDSLFAALHSRPKAFTRFVGPNLGLGLAVGVDPTGNPRVLVGVMINLGGIKP